MTNTCLPDCHDQGSSLKSAHVVLGYVGKKNMSNLGGNFFFRMMTLYDNKEYEIHGLWLIMENCNVTKFLIQVPFSEILLDICLLLLLHVAVADVLLWRDKKQTLTTVFILVAIYFNFIAPGYTIITAVSKLLLVVSVFLFIHGILPEKVYALYSFSS